MDITWTEAGEYTDIRYELSGDGIAKSSASVSPKAVRAWGSTITGADPTDSVIDEN